MIKYDYKITVNKDSATMDKDIYLYKGNKNVHYYFTIEGASFAFKQGTDLLESTNAMFAGITVIKPNGVEVANTVAPVEDGKIHLKVTEDLIDEDVEIGDLDLVFDLFDDVDGAVTIPKISGQFHVKDRPCTTPIGTLQEDTNVVNLAVVDIAYATSSNEQVVIFDDDDNYVKTVWMSGNRITAERLNKIEEGIRVANDGLKNKVEKVAGKGLSTNDFTNEYRNKLEGLGSIEIPASGNITFNPSTKNLAIADMQTNQLLIGTSVKKGYYINDSGVVSETNMVPTNFVVNDYFAVPIFANKTVNVKWQITKEVTTFSVAQYDRNKQFISKSTASSYNKTDGFNVDISENTYYVRFWARCFDVQLTDILFVMDDLTNDENDSISYINGIEIQDHALREQMKNISEPINTDYHLGIKSEDGKVYLMDGDEYVGEGIELPSGNDVDLSTLSLVISGQTIKLMEGSTELSSQTIPTATVTSSQVQTAIQSFIDAGTLGTLSLGDQSITKDKLAFDLNEKKILIPNSELFDTTQHKGINNNGDIYDDTTYRRAGFMDYIDLEEYAITYANSIKGIPCIQVEIKNGYKYYPFFKRISDNSIINATPYGYTENVQIPLREGYKFALYVSDNTNKTITEILANITISVTSIEEASISQVMDKYCTKLGYTTQSFIYVPGQGSIKNKRLIAIENGEEYHIVFKGSKDMHTTVENIQNQIGPAFCDASLVNIVTKGGGVCYKDDNVTTSLRHRDNKFVEDFVYYVKPTNENIKYLLMSTETINVLSNGTYPIEIYKGLFHDEEYLARSKKYGFELDGEMSRKIKNYNNKYKRYKGMYERLEDGKAMHYNMAGYSYPLSRDEICKKTYYNGEPGDFYLFGEDDFKLLDESIAKKGDIVYFDGKNLKAEPNPFWREGNNVFQDRYDVFIAGGGSGAVGSAFALKDLGYKVCLVEKLGTLGGTHSHTAIIGQIASPIGDWYKEVMMASIPYSSITVAGSIVNNDNINSLFNQGQVSLNSVQHGKHTVVNPIWYRNYLEEALRGKIDIKFNMEIIDNKTVDGKMIYATVKNTITGEVQNVYADYFIDCTADNYLLRANTTLNTDYYIGSDPKALYNERAITDGATGDIYELNAYEVDYYYGDPQYNKLSSDDREIKYTDLTKIEQFDNLINKMNGQFNICRGYSDFTSNYSAESSFSVMSPDYSTRLPQNWFYDYGYDYTYKNADKYAKSWFKYKTGGGHGTFRGTTELLGMREGYRMKCDRMFQQSDVETRVTLENIPTEHYIALSTWYADYHLEPNKTSTFNSDDISNSWLNGIPYECLIPSAYKNCLVASRGFGASHIGASAVRLVRTMMSLGYAAGKAIQLAKDNNLDDVRDVNITGLQTAIGMIELFNNVQARIDELNATT